MEKRENKNSKMKGEREIGLGMKRFRRKTQENPVTSHYGDNERERMPVVLGDPRIGSGREKESGSLHTKKGL